MRVCYLIQTHKNSEQISRLVQTIKKSSPNSLIIVSHDFSGCQLDINALNQIPEVEILCGRGGRGYFSLVEGYLDAIDWLLNRKIQFDWLINLSGQDYPLQPLSQVDDFLSKTKYDGFLEYFEVFSPESHWSAREGYERFFYKYKQFDFLNKLPDWGKTLLTPVKFMNLIQPFVKVKVAYGMVGVRTSTPFDEKFKCYGGSFFCTLSRKCVEYLHDFYCSTPEIIEYYKGVCNSDESFWQTILVNSKLFNLCNDNKVYFNFSGNRNGRPQILTASDYPTLNVSNAHFARKFDFDADKSILDILDAKIFSLSPENPLEPIAVA